MHSKSDMLLNIAPSDMENAFHVEVRSKAS